MSDLRPPGWEEYDAIQSIIEGVDEVTRQHEAVWGVGRLDLLVSDELRVKFRKQIDRFNAAIYDHNLDAVRKSGEAMKRAWITLAEAAIAAGHKPLEPEVWEIAMPDGKVIAFTKTNAEAAVVTRSGRYLDVWTVEEVARIIHKFPEIALAKQTFPGAMIKSARVRPSVIDWKIGDDIPFLGEEVT